MFLQAMLVHFNVSLCIKLPLSLQEKNKEKETKKSSKKDDDKKKKMSQMENQVRIIRLCNLYNLFFHVN